MIALPPTDKKNNCLTCGSPRTGKKDLCACKMALYDKKGKVVKPKKNEMWICNDKNSPTEVK